MMSGYHHPFQRSPLCTASHLGDVEEVQRLLNKGVDLNAEGGHYGTALQVASYKGNENIVQLLLKSGADVNAQGERYGTALQAAIYGRDKNVVKLLLESGADINAQGGLYGNALQAASYGGDENVVKVLLERGADINAQGGYFGSALQAASSNPYSTERVKELLLEKGAVNVLGEQYGNAPTLKLSGDHKKMLGEQLDKVADANAQSGQHDHALQVASYKGRKKSALQVQAESNLGLDETTYVPIPKATRVFKPVVPIPKVMGDDGSESGNEILSKDDEDFQVDDQAPPEYDSQLASLRDRISKPVVPVHAATKDDSSGSGYSIMSDDDEDFEIDVSTPPEYDSPLASLRDRISKPVEYFDRLRALAHVVYQHSTLQTYSKSYSPRILEEEGKDFKPCPGYPESLNELTPDILKPLPDADVMRICRDVGVTHKAFASDLLEILECRNVNAQTYSNLRRLQLQGFCLQKFSILTIDPYRHDVARLLPIDVQQILRILKEIESVLRKISDFARRAPASTLSAKVLFEQALGERDDILLSVPCCTNFLSILGLVLATPSDTRTHLSISAALRLVVNTVDLAVASYAGAHLSRFDKEYLGEDIAVIDVLGPFASLHTSQTPLVKLSRCQLQCLDLFHNSQPVWVFSLSDWELRGHLFLSTKVEDFADIWGPLWKVVDSEVQNSCTRYFVGNGCIYKWKSHKAIPRLLENETLCHWISNSTIEPDSEYSTNSEELVFPDIIDEGFDGNETLLIGAVAAGCERLVSKRNCRLDLDKTRSALDDDGRVQMLGTVKEHTYKDSETYQLQAGHGGMNVSASKQYKRQGQSLKQAFVELWTTTPELRDPRFLQDFYGLEISLCTQNAQRIQLGRILGLGSMCQYLRSFPWKTKCAKQAYFDALEGFREDSDALQHTWQRHNQYQEEFGRAVLVCLQALEKTGINHKGQLSAFLSSEVTARPELISMEPKEHSWIGLLKDSENSCCMAVIGDECLEFKHELGSICGRSGRSVLRTALVINCRNKPRGICKVQAYRHEAEDGWTSRWSVKTMDISSDVWLGRLGTLRLLSRLPEGTLLMDWRAPSIITAMKSFIIDKERPHREYSENIRKEARRTRPVPLFVMSDP